MSKNTGYLPNFCHVRIILALLIMAELLSFILTLSPYNSHDRWADLAFISLFIQWLTLLCAAALCVVRNYLNQCTIFYSTLGSLLLIITIIALFSETIYHLLKVLYFNVYSILGLHYYFIYRNIAIGTIIGALVLRYFYIQYQWQSLSKAETEARLQALQAHIRPHFLFNSMNTIASLTRINPELAEKVTENLADLFRASLNTQQNIIRFEKEIQLSKQYMDIEQLRLGERLKVHYAIDNIPKDALIPALSLQPLLENAVYHGIEPSIDGGVVSLQGEYKNKQLYLIITNPYLSQNTQRKGNQIAQKNIEQRLRTYFSYRVKLEATCRYHTDPPVYYLQIIIPYINRMEELEFIPKV